MGVKLNCEEVWRETSSYMEGTLPVTLRRRMERHMKECPRCRTILEGTRNAVALMGDERAFEVPADVKSRLYSKLDRHLDGIASNQRDQIQGIPIGITSDKVSLGSHLIYFWESDEDFERGVRFLYPGLGQGEHCILFGHDEALSKAIEVLRAQGFDPEELIRNMELTVLHRHASAQATLSDIGDVVQAAIRSGATAVRFLGNLGMGRDPLPAGEDDVLELESKATALISQLPCVIVCMYDVRTLSGRLILKGGLQTHDLAVCHQGITKNPYYCGNPDPFPHTLRELRGHSRQIIEPAIFFSSCPAKRALSS